MHNIEKEKKAHFILGIIICTIGAIFYCYEFILRATPGIMVHELMSHFNVSAKSIALLSVYYYYLYTPLQLPAGVLIDKYGPRKLLSGSILLCTLGSILMYLAIDIGFSCFSQFIIGAGSAFAFVGAMKLASNWLPRDKFALFAGITTTLGMLGAVGTDAFLIKLLDHTDWQNIWFYLALAGIIISIIMFLLVKDSPESLHSEKLTKAKEIRKHHINWHDFFRAVKHLFLNRTFWLNSIIGGILFAPLTVIGTLWGVPFLMDAYGYDHNHAGIGTSMIFLGMALGGPIVGILSEKIKNRFLLIRLGCIITGILATLLFTIPNMQFITICLIIFGIGFFISPEILIFSIATSLVDHRFSGTAVAATNFSVNIVGMSMQPLIGKFLDDKWNGVVHQSGHAVYQIEAYHYALAIIPILCFIALVLSFFMENPRHE